MEQNKESDMKAQLEKGYVRIANQIIETLCQINLSAYENRVLMCIFRKTYGFNKKEDWIANSQIVKQTGLHKAHVSRTVKKLKNRLIVAQTGNKLKINTNTSSWLPKEITIKKLPKQATQLPKEVTAVTQIGYKKLPKEADTIDNKDTITKDTIQKKYISIKDLKDIHFKKIAKKYNVPMSFVRSKYDDMVNWHESTGKRKKDWVATLRNFVKTDAIKIKKDQNDKRFDKKAAIDASNL